MADTVDSKVLRAGRFYVIHLQNQSDGTGESAVNKVDISTLTLPDGRTCTYTSVYAIYGMVFGGGSVRLYWDHTTDDEIASVGGVVDLDWSGWGGNVDPKSSGGTGDILLTTNGFSSGYGYDLTLVLLLKA